MPLRLTGGAFSVYQQLSSADKGSFDKIKAALTSAFAVDKFIAYEQFVGRKLRDSESVNVYLADLRRLAELFGGIPEAGLSCAFVAGLPDSARHVLRAGSRLEELDIHQIVTRARAVLAEENVGAGAASVCHQHRAASTTAGVLCRACNQPNHFARSCTARRGWRRGGRGNARCYGCGQPGHFSGLSVNGALPEMQLLLNGVNCDALIDTGCTKCIVHASLCSRWTRENVSVTTVSGERYKCLGTSWIQAGLCL